MFHHAAKRAKQPRNKRARTSESPSFWPAGVTPCAPLAVQPHKENPELMKKLAALAASAAALLAPALASAEEAAAEVAPTAASATEAATNALFTANNVWMMLATALVFIMHMGFATLESGLTRSKNTVNVLFKNVYIVCIGLLTYYVCGFNLMYPGDFNGYFGFAGFGISPPENG